MKRSSAVFSRVVTWLVCGSACLGAAIGVGCVVETAPPADDLGEDDLDDLEYRAGECGAQQKKGMVSQTCKYTIQAGDTTATKGTCLPDGDGEYGDQIECEFELKPCYFYGKSTTAPACLSGEPQCPSKPNEPPITYKTVYDISSGGHICDPNNKTAEQRRSFCHDVYLVGATPSKLIDGKPLRDVLAAQCLAKTTPDVVKDVECCVAKPPKAGGSSSGDSGQGCEGDTAWTTSGDATSWEESGDGSAGTSGDSGSGPGDSGAGECPDGSTLQCSGGDGAPYSCTCVVDAPPPPPEPLPVPAW